jgi:uncharacterized SAM-binding protein YcdF (DUF218 family)
VSHAVHLWQAGQGNRLLVTGGLGKYPPAEAHLMQQLALAAGIPEIDIVIEDQAVSTFQSALYCARILHQHGWATALVVTDYYHLPRALLTFRSLGIRARGSAPVGGLSSRRRWKQWYARLRELPALMWYLGRIVALKVRRRGRSTEPA